MSQQWQAYLGDVDLAPGQVHVWRIPLDQWAADTSVLTADERIRAERFHRERDRRCFVTARCGLRQILGRYLAQDAAAIEFCYGQYGKPFLTAAPIEFNLSHSAELAVVAVAIDRPVGVDLERIKPVKDLEQLTARFFTPGEHQQIMILPPDQRLLAFFRIWTCKEAYLKATGDGLRQLKGLEVSLNSLPGVQLIHPPDWHLQEIQPGEGFVGAIAAPGFDWRVQLFDSVNL